jgi:phage-related protein
MVRLTSCRSPAAAHRQRPGRRVQRDVRQLDRVIQIGVYCSVPEKPVAWLGTSLADLRAFPKNARREAGHQLCRVQQGLLPTDWKPMTQVGAGVIEIRIRTRVEHRVFYIAKFEEAVYVIRAFEKRTRQTPQRDITLAQRRLAELIRRRNHKPKDSRP